MTLSLTPHGRLLSSEISAPFERGTGHGLLHLTTAEVADSSAQFWQEFALRYISALCATPDAKPDPPPAGELDRMAASAPPMQGIEYLTTTVLADLWRELDAAFHIEQRESKLDTQAFLRTFNPAWNVVGRVHFNLAENRKDPEAPFAFLATYTHRLTSRAKPQHLPLGAALSEYAGEINKPRLLSLLLPVQRASATLPWLKQMVDEGEIYQTLRWTPAEALELLRDVPQLESAGVIVRMPAAWRGNRPSRPRVTGRVGTKAPNGIGKDALLDFRMEITLDGEALTADEIRELLAKTDGLALVRGKWVEIDRDQLAGMIERFRDVERAAKSNGLAFGEAMRLLAGADVQPGDTVEAEGVDWAQVVAGPWLAETLKGLRDPQNLANIDPGADLHGNLRPYQQVGVRWLHLLAKLGLGACLADDMGLGKTLQVLSLLLILKKNAAQPSVLVAPASLLANWASEIERFTPSLRSLIAHPSAMSSADLKSLDADRLRDTDLVITSYGSLLRLPWIVETPWRLAILDEAQAIKNPDAKQTRAVKQIKASARLALTGTPVENRLGDLWSIFDFVNPGLLGTSKQFTAFAKRLADRQHDGGYGPLRELVRPYILRRLKTDKSVISDLPDKTEIKAFCPLSRQQAVLYEQAVKDLAQQLEQAEGIQRKGLVLSFLMRFKQICNHPSQWLSDGAWDEADSGKFARLREIAEVIRDKQEKMLVFTQFREVTVPLAAFLSEVFGRPGLVLHGETEVKKRKDLVRQFQEDESTSFFVLSLKAGGSGLNLTAASHVVHFDRWWNPAVENQATDRAFRIGQTKNVLVHKFVCRGTVEEKIDELIESKRQMSHELLEGGADLLLTEMTDEQLLNLVALDINKALKES